MKQEVEDEEIRLKETRDREMMELKQKSKDDLKEEEKKMRYIISVIENIIC